MISRFHIPTKPYTIIDAINRRAAATGSVRYAQLSADADYNGHSLVLHWNDYRGYYVGEYNWGERVVFARSADFATALVATISEFGRQGRGASCRITVGTDPQFGQSRHTLAHDFAADVAVASGNPALVAGEETSFPFQVGWKWEKLGDALFRDSIRHGCDCASALIRANTPEEYAELTK